MTEEQGGSDCGEVGMIVALVLVGLFELAGLVGSATLLSLAGVCGLEA